MSPNSLVPDRMMDDVLPFLFILVLAALVVVPFLTFSVARKWSQTHPEIATGALSAAVIVSVVGIFATVFLSLAVTGWIPPLPQLLGRGPGN